MKHLFVGEFCGRCGVDQVWICVDQGVDFGVILEGVFGVILVMILVAGIIALKQGRASLKSTLD